MKLSVPLKRTLGASLVALSFSACSGNETPDALLAKAQESISASDPRSAEIYLKNLLQQDDKNAEARFLLGQLYLQGNDLRSAEKELRRARDLGYDPKRVVPALFETMLALGEAQRLVDEAKDVALGGDALADARIRTAVARAQLQLGRRDEARKAYDAALAAKADHTPAKVGLATLQALTDRAGARTATERILKDDPESADALTLKADLDIADREFEAARDSLAKVARQQPYDITSRAKLVSVSLELNDLEAAERDLAELRKLAPKAPVTHYLIALIHSRKNDLKTARDEVEEALRLAPEYLPAVGLAAGLSLSANAFEQAERYSRQLIDRLPQNPVGFRVLGATYLRRNEPQKALDAVRPGLKRHPDDAPMLAIAGEAALKLNQAKEAAGFFQRASDLSPDSSRSRTGLALSHIAAGDTSSGIEELEEAIELDAGNLQADVALITTLLRSREFDKALAAVERMEKKAPTSPLPANLRGTVLAAKGDVAGARAAFEKSLQTEPKFLAAAANLATLDLREGRPGDARQRFETLLSKDPKNAQAAVSLAVLTARTGGTRDEVLGLLKRAREANPDAVLPILATARYLIETKTPKDAIPLLQEAANRNPSDARIVDQLALAFRQSGQSAQAIASWEKVLRLNPKAGLAQFRIGETQLADGDRDAALASFRKASEIAPDAVEPRIAMAGLLQQQGRGDEAMRIATRMRENEKTKVPGLMLEGDLNAAGGKLPEAIAKYRAAFAEQKALPIGSKLHRALLAAKKEGEADRMLRDWIRAEPSNLRLRMFAGESQTARRHWKESFEQYAVVLEKEPKNAIALNNAAWALYELKDERAAEYGRRAYEAAPKSAAVVDTYGTILVAKGDRKGVELLREAVSLAPTSAPLRLHLAQALAKFDDKAGARAEVETLLKTTSEGPVADAARGLLTKLD